MSSVQDIQAYNCDMWGLNKVPNCCAQSFRQVAFCVISRRTLKGCRSQSRPSHWIVDATALAYVSAGLQCPIGVRAHSTRRMASSWAWSSGISIGEICVAAGWSSPLPLFDFTIRTYSPYRSYLPPLGRESYVKLNILGSLCGSGLWTPCWVFLGWARGAGLVLHLLIARRYWMCSPHSHDDATGVTVQ